MQPAILPASLPDYPVPFDPGLGYGDADGEVCVARGDTLPPHPSMDDILRFVGLGGASRTYMIFDRTGQHVGEFAIPYGDNIVGFAQNAVYVTTREADGTALMRARIR